MAEMTVRGNEGSFPLAGFAGGEYGLDGGEHFWSLPNEVGDLSAALQTDLGESRDTCKIVQHLPQSLTLLGFQKYLLAG